MEPGARDRPARGGDRASGHSTFHEFPARFHGSKEQAGERYAAGHFALYGEAARGREQTRRRPRGEPKHPDSEVKAEAHQVPLEQIRHASRKESESESQAVYA